jgi:hypothetical protein
LDAQRRPERRGHNHEVMLQPGAERSGTAADTCGRTLGRFQSAVSRDAGRVFLAFAAGW